MPQHFIGIWIFNEVLKNNYVCDIVPLSYKIDYFYFEDLETFNFSS